ncbi:MAG: hypothetical protein JST83_05425 [Bacteroidetes bacterium]|nr:hypothetical protein [Bacteroidota bacterium]
MAVTLEIALKRARQIQQELEPHCERVDILGSIRRKKPEVKDIEIMCLPKRKVRQPLFGDPIIGKRIASFTEAVTSLGRIIKGSPADGRYVQIDLWDIKLDLFIPQEQDYFRQYAIRTGSAQYSQDILARAWRKRGWVGTEDGLRRESECIERSGKTWKCKVPEPTLPPVWASEEAFYKWLGVTWIAPENRELRY